MNSIPKPGRKKLIPPDPSAQYLQRWKKLFSDLDPENITVSIKGDEAFPCSYSFGFNESRLSDHYDVDVQLYVSIGGGLACVTRSNICCCLGDSAFFTGWIFEDDENYDAFSEGPYSWKELYERLVIIIEQHRKRIPVPPPEEIKIQEN